VNVNPEKPSKIGRRRRWVWIVCAAVFIFGLLHLLSNTFREEEKQLRRQLRETVKEQFPEQTAQYSKTIGLFAYEDAAVDPDRKSVVLIHGLDDPGRVWQNLAPVLADADFNVWLMHYPNDQPVAESARLFLKEMQTLRQTGIARISIVAHSMGGLVTREMLTRAQLGYRRQVENEQVPEVNDFIMVATPNHGSQLARFRMFAEVRDQATRLADGNANWLGVILDGAGEAKIDLLPGSRFLTELNRRPHPQGVDMLIIAGVTSPWDEDDIREWVGGLKENVPTDQREKIDAFGAELIDMTHELGDGLVTVASTRLAGVDHKTVEGNHLTIIRNVTRSSQRTPPAVPIIIERLKK
jgi:pimeloyl-ACP methyl ester carboxylesterase